MLNITIADWLASGGHRPSFFELISEGRGFKYSNKKLSRNKYFEDICFLLQTRRLSVYDYFRAVYERLPYSDELRDISNKPEDLQTFICNDIQAPRFSWAIVNAIASYTGACKTVIIHPPKTAGTAFAAMIENNTSYPVWSADYEIIPDENILKLPDLFDNAAIHQNLFVRSHLTLSDQLEIGRAHV